VFQTVGAVFLLGSCGFWSLSGVIAPDATADVDTWAALFTPAHAGAAALAAGLLTTFVGGAALATVGMGLTGQTRRSGVLATILALAMATAYAAIAVILVVHRGLCVAAAVATVFALVCVVLGALAVHSASLLRRFPPPPDQNKATKAFLQAHERKRAARIRRESL